MRSVGAECVTLCSGFPHPNAVVRTPIDEVFRRTNPELTAAEQDLVINGNGRRLFRLG